MSRCPDPALCQAGDQCAGRCRSTITRPATPAGLEQAGYRIEYGDASDDPVFAGKYWWSWCIGHDISVSNGIWDTPERAIQDAWRDLEAHTTKA